MKIKLTFYFIFFCTFATINACSTEAWYKGSATSHDIRCLQESKSEYEQCVNDNRHSHDEYQQTKDQLKKDNNP